MFQLDTVLAQILNANSPDLSHFRARGGKLLGFHGWADPLVPPQDFINYYLRVASYLDIRNQQPWLLSDADLISNAIAARLGGGTTALDDSIRNRQVQDFFRLFTVPGMGHCGGGPGPNQFYNATISPVPADAQHNALLALQQWVEQGIAPEQIIATKYLNDDPSQGVVQTRPLCVFPQVSHYRGQGNPNDASNFECVPGTNQANVMAAPEYLR